MTKELLKSNAERIRKVELAKKDYIQPTSYTPIFDKRYEGELKENSEMWLNSFIGKSQYEITENLCVNW